jgi:hypothetical protein
MTVAASASKRPEAMADKPAKKARFTEEPWPPINANEALRLHFVEDISEVRTTSQLPKVHGSGQGCTSDIRFAPELSSSQPVALRLCPQQATHYRIIPACKVLYPLMCISDERRAHAELTLCLVLAMSSSESPASRHAEGRSLLTCA